MTEIDFDELDKAVNSLMNKHNSQSQQPVKSSSPAEGAGPTDNSPSEEPTNDNLAMAPAPEQPAEQGATSDTSAERPASSSNVVRRPSGRFMDVVHPSSDMRSHSQMQAPSTRPSRESKPLEPVSQSGAVGDLDQDLGAVSNHQTSLGEVNQPKFEEDVLQHEDFTTDSDLEPADEMIASPAPMQSPFLSDVEVDKRPLGGSEPQDEEVLQPSAAEEMEEVDSAQSTMPDPIGDWQPEADNQVSSQNEADDAWSSETKSTDGDTPEVKQPEIPELSAEVLALESDAATEARHETEAKPATDMAPVQPATVPGDIPRQYSADTTDDGPEPSAVFEAAAESPQELKHPEKKKSGWSIVVWILLLVIIGAGGGVAAWYFLLK